MAPDGRDVPRRCRAGRRERSRDGLPERLVQLRAMRSRERRDCQRSWLPSYGGSSCEDRGVHAVAAGLGQRDDLARVAELDLVLCELVLVVDDDVTRRASGSRRGRGRPRGRSSRPRPAAWSCRRTPRSCQPARVERRQPPALDVAADGRRAQARPGRARDGPRAPAAPSACRRGCPIQSPCSSLPEPHRRDLPVRPAAPLLHLDADRISELEPHTGDPIRTGSPLRRAWCAGRRRRRRPGSGSR